MIPGTTTSGNISTNGQSHIVAEYNYRDERGVLLYQSVRYEPKSFRQRRPVGKGWAWDLKGVRRVVYRLPELVAASKEQQVFIVEGEKDADNLIGLGLVATTAAMGAKAPWLAEYSESLRGRTVTIIPDNDPPGREHARKVATALHGIAADVATLHLPNLLDKEDVSDWLDKGGTAEMLLELAGEAEPWLDHRPATPPASVPGVPDSWPQPIPLNVVPIVPDFPIEVLPPVLASFAREVAWSLNVPLDFVACPMLAIAGGAIGNSRRILITESHPQSACLFMATIGPPGSGKSPAQEEVASPLDQADRRLVREWKMDLRDWQDEDADDRGDRPVLQRAVLDDCTTEVMASTLADSPRGVAMIRDELSALITGMNQYKGGKGHDRQVFLKLWSHGTIRVDRKNNKDGIPILIERPFVAIVGGIQPTVVERLRGDHQHVDDGFLDRFLFTYPVELPAIKESWREITDQSRSTWINTIDTLLKLEMVGQDRRPCVVRLSTEARQEWEKFTEEHAAEINSPDFPEHLRGAWSKLLGYCGRLTLILHELRRVCAGQMSESMIMGESITHAAKLISYFKGHRRKVSAMMDADPRLGDARKLWGWIEREQRTEFKAWEAHKDLQSERFPTPDSLDTAMNMLIRHQLIRQQELPDRKGPGRKPAVTYQVNPLALGVSGKSGESGK